MKGGSGERLAGHSQKLQFKTEVKKNKTVRLLLSTSRLSAELLRSDIRQEKQSSNQLAAPPPPPPPAAILSLSHTHTQVFSTGSLPNGRANVGPPATKIKHAHTHKCCITAIKAPPRLPLTPPPPTPKEATRLHPAPEAAACCPGARVYIPPG